MSERIPDSRPSGFGIYVSRHLQVFFDTLGRLWKTPMATVMTVLVLAIAMTLPMVLYRITDSIAQVTAHWTGSPKISVFVHRDGDFDPREVGREFLNNPLVDDVEYVSPEQGLAEFSAVSGMEEAIQALPSNPLPPLLLVSPAAEVEQAAIDDLVDALTAHEKVDTVIYDQRWLTRVHAIVGVFGRGVLVLSVLMGIGILLVIGNTVRLGITHRAAEIEILDQVGGTRSFIRRPFLYHGAIQSLLGGLLAWLLTNLTLYLLAKPIRELATLYQSDFRIGWAGFGLGFGVIGLAVLLGLIAARVTVDRHLRRVRPH